MKGTLNYAITESSSNLIAIFNCYSKRYSKNNLEQNTIMYLQLVINGDT